MLWFLFTFAPAADDLSLRQTVRKLEKARLPPRCYLRPIGIKVTSGQPGLVSMAAMLELMNHTRHLKKKKEEIFSLMRGHDCPAQPTMVPPLPPLWFLTPPPWFLTPPLPSAAPRKQPTVHFSAFLNNCQKKTRQSRFASHPSLCLIY